jgi:predicted nucleic acid-binding protein
MTRTRSKSVSGTHAAPPLQAPIVAEPPASYRVEPPLVPDSSMLGALLFQEPERSEAQTRIAGRELNAPTLLDYEIVNIALKKARQGQPAMAAQGLAQYPELPLRLHNVDAPAVFALAERYSLTAYDAAYLWLAAELKVPLVTFDRKLGMAAQRHLGALE